MPVHYDSAQKKTSAQIILDTIRWNYPISRIDLAQKTDFSVASISRIVAKLIEDGFIEEISSEFNGLGRKTSLLTLKSDSILTAGAEYDGEYLKITLIDNFGKPMASSKNNYNAEDYTPEEMAGIIYRDSIELIENSGRSQEMLFGIGVGIPGIIDNISGNIIFSSQLGWKNVNFKKMMEEKSGKYCVIENDVKANIYGEYIFGVAKGSQISVLISFGSGLGSAIIIDGKILRGVSNSAGEIGHITQDTRGRVCKCGKIGCLQTNIAKSFILDEGEKIGDVHTISEFMDAALKKEVWARRILEKLIVSSAIAIDTAVCMYNPDTVILCGEMVDDYPSIFSEISSVFYNNYLWDYLKDTFRIHHSTFREMGSAVGAAAICQEGYFQMPG